jgi:hypothetical protein
MINPKMTQKLLTILRSVENRFGPRIEGWTIKPVDVAGSSFPETTVDTIKKAVQVRITASTNRDPMQATYQLAHETIHCLAPAGRRDAIWFEEGFANHFALTYPELSRRYRAEAEASVPALFVEPLDAFRSLNATDEQIGTLRQEQPLFDELTPELIQKYFSAPAELARKLCDRLPLNRPSVL